MITTDTILDLQIYLIFALNARSGLASDVPISIPSQMMKTVAENPDLPALKTRNINGQVSKADIILRSWKLPPIFFAKVFEFVGLNSKHHSVPICSFFKFR